jgi:hypothetical protein
LLDVGNAFDLTVAGTKIRFTVLEDVSGTLVRKCSQTRICLHLVTLELQAQRGRNALMKSLA